MCDKNVAHGWSLGVIFSESVVSRGCSVWLAALVTNQTKQKLFGLVCSQLVQARPNKELFGLVALAEYKPDFRLIAATEYKLFMTTGCYGSHCE